MNIEVNNLEDLKKCGVYKILNISNNKYYIGSTKQTFQHRLNHHLQALRNNTHKNSHLQHAWNKYGEENFKFLIIEVCERSVVYDREQFYLDQRDLTLAYNINPLATGPCMTKESIDKQVASRKKFNKEAREIYDRVKNNEINLDDVDKKYKNIITLWMNHEPWNKNKKYKSTDHLKVKHTMTDKLKETYKNHSKKFREEADIVYVYDSNLKFLDRFRSAKDIEELSEYLDFPIKSRFKVARGKCSLKTLQSSNINRAIKLNEPYKGLFFTNEPRHPGMDDVNEPKSVETWNGNAEVITESNTAVTP